jgi:hypothetical protein
MQHAAIGAKRVWAETASSQPFIFCVRINRHYELKYADVIVSLPDKLNSCVLGYTGDR